MGIGRHTQHCRWTPRWGPRRLSHRVPRRHRQLRGAVQERARPRLGEAVRFARPADLHEPLQLRGGHRLLVQRSRPASEEHPLVHGKPSGVERWWDEDQKTVYSETGWVVGAWHGIKRHWTKARPGRAH